MRIVGGAFRGRPLATPQDACDPPDERPRARGGLQRDRASLSATISTARACSTFSPAPVRSGSKPCRAARPIGVFIEESAEGRGLIRTNVEAFGLSGRTKIFRRDATRLGEAGTLQPFDLVFADPPYGKGLGELALVAARDGGWLKPGALCLVEEAAATPFQPPAGFHARRAPRLWRHDHRLLPRCLISASLGLQT